MLTQQELESKKVQKHLLRAADLVNRIARIGRIRRFSRKAYGRIGYQRQVELRKAVFGHLKKAGMNSIEAMQEMHANKLFGKLS